MGVGRRNVHPSAGPFDAMSGPLAHAPHAPARGAAGGCGWRQGPAGRSLPAPPAPCTRPAQVLWPRTGRAIPACSTWLHPATTRTLPGPRGKGRRHVRQVRLWRGHGPGRPSPGPPSSAGSAAQCCQSYSILTLRAVKRKKIAVWRFFIAAFSLLGRFATAVPSMRTVYNSPMCGACMGLRMGGPRAARE